MDDLTENPEAPDIPTEAVPVDWEPPYTPATVDSDDGTADEEDDDDLG